MRCTVEIKNCGIDVQTIALIVNLFKHFTNFYAMRQRFSSILLTRNSYEKMRQILVRFSVQSRKEMSKESLLSCLYSLTFSWRICHLWLLRVSYVAFDLVICGI